MSASSIHNTNTTTQSGVSPEPSEALQRANGDWVQIAEKYLDRHCLAGEFFISKAALASVVSEGGTVDGLLPWFNSPRNAVRVGDTVAISDTLQAFFGFDKDKPNRVCFFVEIDLIRRGEPAVQ